MPAKASLCVVDPFFTYDTGVSLVVILPTGGLLGMVLSSLVSLSLMVMFVVVIVHGVVVVVGIVGILVRLRKNYSCYSKMFVFFLPLTRTDPKS